MKHMAIGSRIVALAALLVAGAAVASDGQTAVEVDGTSFKVTFADGRVLTSPDLIGATLTISTSSGPLRLRIDAVERDPGAANGEVWLHTFSSPAADGEWRNMCEPGPDGRRQGFPLGVRPRLPDGMMEPAEPGVFELVCSAGARGKCVRFGYRPWESAAMLAIYNACVRMVRADYCGDGKGTTRNGMLIDVYDDRGIQIPDDKQVLPFEAGWTEHGAVCVSHVRVKENVSLGSLVKACPRLEGHIGESCTEETARSLGANLFNRSHP